jgi:hypothetical protein
MIAQYSILCPEVTSKGKRGGPYVRRKQASEYLEREWGVPAKPRTLAKLAVVGGGPRFFKAGRTVLYSLVDLDAYAQGKISSRSYANTTEAEEAE